MKSFVAFVLLIVGVSASTIRLHEKRILREEPILVRALEQELVEPVVHLKKKHIPILSLKNEIRGAQSNDLEFLTANGISVSEHTQSVPGVRSSYVDESGQLVESDSTLVKTGSYSYTSPEGIPITATWIADENGFRIIGDHLPTPVELPAEHAQLRREALARVGLVDPDSPIAPLHYVHEEVAPLKIKTHRHRPSHLRLVESIPTQHFELRSKSHLL